MPDITIRLDDKTYKRLMELALHDEPDRQVAARLLTFLVKSPRAENVDGFLPVMAPHWFQKLGKVSDKKVAAEAKGVKPSEIVLTDIARINVVRNEFGIDTYKKGKKPKKELSNEFRMKMWTSMKAAGISNAALAHSLGFHSVEDAITWAREIELTEMVERLSNSQGEN